MDEPREEYPDFTQFTARVQTAEKGEMTFNCNPSNTTLYLHHPDRNEQFDHFFYRLSEEELPEEHRGTGRNMGGFLWREVLGEEQFEQLAGLVTDSCEWDVVYRPEPLETDRQHYIEFAIGYLALELDDIDPNDFI